MWQEMFNNICITISVIFTACAVKITDDFLDKEADFDSHTINWAAIIGNGAMVYAIILMIFAGALSAVTAFSLFLSSYAIGMFHDLEKPFPLGLKGWHEAILCLILGVCLWGWEAMSFSFIWIAAIQLIDDYIDLDHDSYSGQRNWVKKIGFTETVISIIIGILLCYLINPSLFLDVALGTMVYYILENLLKRCVM